MDSTLQLIISLQDEAKAGIAELRGELQGVGGASGGAIAGFTALGSAAYDAAQGIVGAVSSSIGAAGDFEAAVNNLGAIAGSALSDAGLSFDDVKAKALDLGATTAFSANQALAAMTELAKGGVPIADVMDQATTATLNLASAGQVELATAAEIVAKQLGVWGETGLTATQAADLLAQGANASTVGVEDLALGLANVGGTAKTAGVEFDDLVQTMALIAPGFSSAADAGTSLKTFLSSLTFSSDSAYQAASELGLVYTDFNAAAAELGLTLADTTTQQEAQAAVAAQLAASLNDPTAQSKEFHSAWLALTADFQTNAFFDAQGQFVGMEAAAGALQTSLVGLSEEEKLLQLNTIFGSDAIRAAAGIANAGAAGFVDMGTAMAGAGTAADVAALQNQGFNFALDAMMGSVETLQVIIGGALLPVLTSLINDVFTPGINTVATFAQAISGSQEAFAQLPGPIQSVITAIQSLLAGDLAGAGNIFAGLLPDPGAVTGQVAGLISGVIGAIGAGLPGVISAAQPYAQAMLQWVVDAAPGLLTNLGGLIAQVLTAIGGALPGIVSAVASYSAAMIEWAIQAAPGLLANLGGLIAQALGWIASQVPGIAGQLGEWALAFLAWVGPTAGQLIIAAGQIVGNLLGWIAENGPGIIATLHTWAEAFVGWVAAEAIPGLLGALAGLLGEVFGWIDSAGANLLGQAGSIGTNIINGIVAGLNAASGGLFSVIAGIIGQTLGAAESAADINSPSQLFADAIGSPIVAGVAMGIVDNVAYLVDAAATMGRVVLEEAQAFAAEVEQAIGPLLAGALQGAADYARAQISGLDLLNGLSTGDAQAKALADQKKLDGDKQKLLDDQQKLSDERAKLQAQIAGGGVDPKDRAKLDASQAKELAKLAEKQAALDAERARLQTTASQNADPEKRAAAEAKLFDLADKQAELDAQRAELATSQAEDRAELAADGDAARLKAQEQLAALDAKALEFEQRRADLHERQYQVDMAKGSAIVNQQIADAAAAQLAEARAAANQIQDPAEASKYYKAIAGFIGEEAKLRQQIASETDDQDRDRLLAKLELVRQAQDAELAVYGNAAQDRQRQRDEDLRLAGEAAKQLRDLVYYSQEDVFGQGEAISRTLGNGIVDGLSTIRGTVNGELSAALASGQAVLRPQTLSSTPPLAASSGGAGGRASSTSTLNITIQLPNGAAPTAEQQRIIQQAVEEALRQAGRDQDVRRRTS